MKVVRNTGINVSPSDDGRLYDQAFTDGLFNAPSITSLGANQVAIGSMYGILCGRDFSADAQTIAVSLPASATTTGYIYIKYDTATSDIISIESALSPFTVTYEDINTSGAVCEMIIAQYTASPTAVTAISTTYPTASVGGVLVVNCGSFSPLPKTVTNAKITKNMVVINSVLSTPSAQTGDWTVNTANGSLTVSGSISGTTTLTLYLQVQQ